MQIDVIADITCPWCFIGLKRLELSVDARTEYNFEFVWRPFLLNPELREGSLDRILYLERVFGSKSRIKQYFEAIGAAGKTVGIDFDFKHSELTPSSIDAHSLIMLAGKSGMAMQMALTLYDAYFVHALDIGDPDVLIDLAATVGMGRRDIKSVLGDEMNANTIVEENNRIHRLGVNGVPSFVFADKNIISGAQEPETLLHMIDLMATLSDKNNPLESHAV